MELKDTQRDFMVAELGALNDDVQRRLGDRFYLVFGVLTVGTSLISVASIPGYTLFVFPWACWLVSLWLLHNEISIKRKNVYIRRVEAAFFPEGFGFLSSKKGVSSPLLSTDHLNIETIINRMIVGAEVGVVAIGALRIATGSLNLATLIVSGVMFIGALVGIVLTLRNDFARREKRLSSAQKPADPRPAQA